ncbi:glycosyltransferase [Marinobacter xestospongiae]|uniref:glycosyltransferase n=1 Tax=Marinobacter xestospongiae TaxID=994319 RepID=UPI002005FF14|nr:glycosyltransferase [Marinobacter xestospongiae]MCK7569147.1 glycosyltransferase [Marinobacter xestospongiae]
MIKVSVIIPVFNDPDRVFECIKGIIRQSYPIDLIELIVVDNASIPALELDNKELSGVNLKLLRCSKPGSYAARNVGVRAASGKVLAFIDADCWPDPEWINSGVSALIDKGKDSFLGGDVKIIKPEKPSAVAVYQHLIGFCQAENITERKFTGTLNLFCFSELFRSVGEFEERLLSGGDREWSWRAVSRGFSIFYEPKAVVYTQPRTTLRGAIRQARRIVAGRKTLKQLGLTYLGQQNLAKKRSAWQASLWIITHKELSLKDRFQVFLVASIIRVAEFVEQWRLAAGKEAERR